uniref:Ubiquitin-related domain-containing protein n=1 Tax=Tanacetum cinerariifolium TaxID=118510 RepID=A0A699GX93_TANCI|nr:ubiquitin-related domain-containing protein [Tanacetum cinerariifolium]
MIPSSCPTLLNDKRSAWKRLSIGISSSQPIVLSILKLDGSSFDVMVARKATVAKLKQAVEALFGHLPTQGDSNISWPHLQFVRHTPVYIVAGERLESFTCNSNEVEGSSSKSELCGDMKNKENLVKNEANEGRKYLNSNKKFESSWSCTIKGLLKHRRQEGWAKGNDRVVKSTVRLGRQFASDDAKTCKASSGSNCNGCGNAYLSNSFGDYLGGFGYPTCYCLK